MQPKALNRKYFGSSKRHNNRKMTKGRKERRHKLGGRRGYVPYHIRHNYKMLELNMNNLERLQSLPLSEKVKQMDRITHLEQLITQIEQKIKEHNAEF